MINNESTDDKKEILLVEDNKEIRELYAVALINEGFNIAMAENGEQGVEMAMKHRPDLILMDIEMPGMTGHEAVEKLREDEWGQSAKVIYLTNRTEAHHVAHATTLESAGFIVKSRATIKELTDTVKNALKS